MKYSPYNKLPLQLALYTAAVSLLLACLISAYMLNNLISRLKDEKQYVRNSLIEATLPAFNLATFNYNGRLNQQLADGLASDPEISSVIILDTDGSHLAKATTTIACQSSTLDQLIFGEANIQMKELKYAGTQLGKLIIELNPCPFRQRFYYDAISIIGGSLLFSMSVALFIYIVFYRRVTRPLTRFARQLATIDASSIDQSQLQDMSTRRQDELGSLINTVVHLLELLRNHIAAQKKAEESVSDYSARLETLINKRTNALTDINRRLTLSSGEHNPRYSLPLLSVLLPGISTALSNIESQLDENGRQLCRRLQILMQQLILIEQAEDADVISLSVLMMAAKASYPGIMTIEINSPDQVLLPRQHTALLLTTLTDIAAENQAPADNITLGVNRRDDIVSFFLKGKNFSLSYDNINTPLSAPLALGPGMLAAISGTLGGEVALNADKNGQQILECNIPAQWLTDLLQPLQQQLRHIRIQLDIHDESLSQQVEQWLSEWNLIDAAAHSEENRCIVLTDQSIPHNRRAAYLMLSPVNSGRRYLQSDLLSDLMQLIPRHEQQRQSTILLVDDNIINRMLCERYLKNLGITPDTVDNGLQALEQARRKHYDLILMDCQMPVMDGFEATRQIRRHSINRETPIIALTGLTDEHERQHCLTAGMSDFIGKPFTQDQIQATLIQWIGYARISRPDPSSDE